MQGFLFIRYVSLPNLQCQLIWNSSLFHRWNLLLLKKIQIGLLPWKMRLNAWKCSKLRSLIITKSKKIHSNSTIFPYQAILKRTLERFKSRLVGKIQSEMVLITSRYFQRFPDTVPVQKMFYHFFCPIWLEDNIFRWEYWRIVMWCLVAPSLKVLTVEIMHGKMQTRGVKTNSQDLSISGLRKNENWLGDRTGLEPGTCPLNSSQIVPCNH